MMPTLERYDGAATPVKIDNLTYGYNKDANGKLVNNRLRHVKDAQSALLCNYDIDNQNDDNYLYDAIGNLTKDNAEGIAGIEWNAYGKISKINRSVGSQKSNLEFIYDAMGNRVCKIEKPYNVTSTGWLYTFYVRDASGNIMSTYTKTGDQIEDAVITLDKVMLYGSSRVGVRMVNKTIAQLEAETSLYLFNRRLGLKRYEMSNHLGNVLTTFTDRKYQVQSSGVVTGYKTYISSAQDYYPFGMIMNGRNYNTSSYRFGFNGMEKDDEISGVGNNLIFDYRILDSRIGRFLSVDPRAKEYPWNSTYAFAENDVIRCKDLEGAEKLNITSTSPGYFSPGEAVIEIVLAYQVVTEGVGAIQTAIDPEAFKSIFESGNVLVYLNSLPTKEKEAEFGNTPIFPCKIPWAEKYTTPSKMGVDGYNTQIIYTYSIQNGTTIEKALKWMQEAPLERGIVLAPLKLEDRKSEYGSDIGQYSGYAMKKFEGPNNVLGVGANESVGGSPYFNAIFLNEEYNIKVGHVAHESGHNSASSNVHNSGNYEYDQEGLSNSNPDKVKPVLKNTKAIINDKTNRSTIE